MRLYGVVLAAALAVALGGGTAAQIAHPQLPAGSLPKAVTKAAYVCGTVDGQYSCRYVATKPSGFGKGARQGPVQSREAPAPAMTEGTLPEAPAATSGGAMSPAPPSADGGACQGGMVGTPPNCSCPPNSELLGGTCVHYMATTCSNGLAADALPQACARVEEKLSCRMRQDGMKDCCCVVYDRL